MATLSDAQLAIVASSAGFRGTTAVMAVAIALAESGGNPSATSITGDVGLWQINWPQHQQYDRNSLFSPGYNGQAAYTLSNGGMNWRPWCTAYSDGACGTRGGIYLGSGSPYQKFVNRANSVVNTGQSSSAGSATGGAAGPSIQKIPLTVNGQKAWYTFPRIDNLGGVEPFGGFPKPDSNIQVPAGYPIIALLPGVVSGINTSDAWGASVTIKLDTPINALATHTAYLHLRCDIQVRTGQRVSFGTLLAYNGSSQACGSQKVPLGFALYNGDMYGHGSAWQYMTKANLNGGPLDPVPLLNSARSGSMSISPGSGGNLITGGVSTTTPMGTYIPLLDQVHQTLIDTPGFYGIALAVDEAEQFPGWIDLTTPQQIATPLGSVSVPDINGEVRSIGATVTDNFLPLVIRGGMVFVGAALFMMLMGKLVEGPVKEILPMVLGAAEAA